MFIKNRDDSSHFISLSDIMTALMMVFLFVSVAIIMQIQKHNEIVTNIQANYKNQKEMLYADLQAEFKDDMSKWGAKINEETLSVYFVGDDVRFDTGQSDVKPEFKATLAEFFPRYVQLIKKHKDAIQEVRIEGYTDSTGKPGQTMEERYFYNMKLSQDRTRSVLEYCLTLPNFTKDDFNYMKDFITANGLSFSRYIRDSKGYEDKAASRRVEFRILTNAEATIESIVKEMN